jgi:hypothetical protein
MKSESVDSIRLIHDMNQGRDVVNPVVSNPSGSVRNFLAN